MLQKSEISTGLMGRLARMQTLPFTLLIKCSAAPPSLSDYWQAHCNQIAKRCSHNETVLGSSRKLVGAAENLIGGSERRICLLSFEFWSPHVNESCSKRIKLRRFEVILTPLLSRGVSKIGTNLQPVITSRKIEEKLDTGRETCFNQPPRKTGLPYSINA